jgi:hypothetical protein
MKTAAAKVQNFLWWVACTDVEAILLCSPVTRFYQTLSGTMILVTALLAFISGGYAIYQVVHYVIPTIPLATLYATSIFSIDRFIVSGRGRRMTWFRLPLALVIGCVIAVPLELRLMQERIDLELTRQERGENQQTENRREEQRDAIRARIAKLEEKADEYRSQMSEWGTKAEAEVVGRIRRGSTGIEGEGPAYRAARAQQQQSAALLSEIKLELEKARTEQTDALFQLEQEYQQSFIKRPRDLLARYEALHAIEQQHPEAQKMTWGTTFVLVLLEVFPALIKLMLPYTAYAALVEAREREDIQRMHSMANHNMSEMVSDPQDATLFVMRQTAAVQQASQTAGE